MRSPNDETFGIVTTSDLVFQAAQHSAFGERHSVCHLRPDRKKRHDGPRRKSLMGVVTVNTTLVHVHQTTKERHRGLYVRHTVSLQKHAHPDAVTHTVWLQCSPILETLWHMFDSDLMCTKRRRMTFGEFLVQEGISKSAEDWFADADPSWNSLHDTVQDALNCLYANCVALSKPHVNT